MCYFIRSALAMAIACVAFTWSAAAGAAIIGTYVDADPAPAGNTGPAAAISAVDSSSDNLWFNRADAATSGAMGGDVLESNGDVGGVGVGGENSPELSTTITGLSPGSTYAIRLVYWAIPGNSVWGLQGALSGGALTTFDSVNGIATGATTNGGQIAQYQVVLGTVSTVDQATVNVDDVSGRRAWYDGVSFQVVPEPSSMVLSLAGLLFAVVCRKRSRLR